VGKRGDLHLVCGTSLWYKSSLQIMQYSNIGGELAEAGSDGQRGGQ
jgi:hypothetical protein